MKHLFLLLLIGLWINPNLYAQDMPEASNQTDAEGRKQGEWIIFFDAKGRITENKRKADTYRLVNYQNDKPIGKVTLYYKNGTPKIVNDSITAETPISFQGNRTFYRPDGNKEKIETYEDGKLITTSFYDKEGNLITEDYKSLNDKARALLHQNKYQEALIAFEEARAQAEVQFGKKHKNYAAALTNLANIHKRLRQYEEAENLFIDAKNIREKAEGKESLNYAVACLSLANFYRDQGTYTRAENLYIETKNMLAQSFGKERPLYAMFCLKLGDLYQIQGRFSEAEKLYLESKEIYTKVSGTDNKDYGSTCNSLSALYEKEGRYREAEALIKEAKDIFAKTKGKKHHDYAIACINLAGLHHGQGQFEQAAALLLEAKDIFSQTVGKTHPLYGNVTNNLATTYEMQEKYEEAENLYIESQNIYAEAFGKEHFMYAIATSNLASMYQAQNKYEEAEKLYLQAKSIYSNTLGNNHRRYASNISHLAGMYKSQGDYKKAELFYKEASEAFIFQIQNNFIGLSEKEKEQYLATFKNNFEIYFSFATQAQNPKLNTWLLENNLITKGLLFYSTNQLRRQLERTQNESLKTQYENWLEKRTALSQAYEMSEQEKEKQNIKTQKLELQVNTIEKELSLLLEEEGIAAKLTPKQRKWKEIKRKLKKGETLVDINRVRYRNEGFTDSLLYVALIVKHNSKRPEMVILPNGQFLEEKALTYYRNAIQYKIEDANSYQVFFEPLKKKIGKSKKVYFSADGVYHQLNLATLFNPKTEKYLSEELDIQLISTARDFLAFGNNNLKKQTEAYKIYLFGSPDFAGDGSQNNTEGSDRNFVYTPLATRLDATKQRYFNSASGRVSYLPGTKTEIEAIQAMASKSNTLADVFIEKDATEENLKSISSPNILHIATHGFFIPEKEKTNGFDNPLLRSGLLLANAEMTLNQKATEETENGILTAQEAIDLDLYHTDLVVLSACETGLGEIKIGEGVFGLQRALQEAGAKTVLMSLWKVDDEATQKMMVLFYENMLLKKQDKRTAFKNAQNSLRQKYPEPYFWGAFVMVGE
ncbi:MAG: CHAT domain-containing protein [Bernardetiaceae bacterium]|nr:CHAT domain-containing protein [Bernardetiaceae bacterium]